MSIAQHAEKILKAWNLADPASFERELDAALASCRGAAPISFMEMEQRELLETVVERLRVFHTTHRPPSGQGLNAGFALLQHLRRRAAA